MFLNVKFSVTFYVFLRAKTYPLLSFFTENPVKSIRYDRGGNVKFSVTEGPGFL